MKIIQITPYYPPHVGGAEKRIETLSKKLAKKGHDIEVFTSDIGCPKNKQLKSTKNLKIHYLPAWEFAHTPLIPSLFSRLMKIPKDSIMHVHIAQAFVPEIVYKVSKKRKIPYIAHIRVNLIKTGKFGFLLPGYKRIFLKRVIQNASKIITLNEDYKNLMSEEYNIPKGRIVVIPNSTEFKIIKDSKQKLIKDYVKLLFVGRLSAEKNIESLIKALFILKNKNIILNLVGGGEKRKDIEDLIKRSRLERRVILKGRLEGKNLYKEYLTSDIVLLPSRTECFSSVLLEAMAIGTPIIASDIMGTRSIIKNNYNGLLVKPTPKKIAEAIEKLIKNPKLRQRLARNGLKEVKKYSWDKIVEQTEQVYQEVLKEHNQK